MKRRATVPRGSGMSYADMNRNCLVTIEDDVLSVKKQILDRWPDFIGDVYWDKDRMVWIITQIEVDGTESLLFESQTLDQRVIGRIEAADRWSRDNPDILDEIDKLNDQREKEIDAKTNEQLVEVADRLRHAWKKDGLYDHPDVYGVRLRGHR